MNALPCRVTADLSAHEAEQERLDRLAERYAPAARVIAYERALTDHGADVVSDALCDMSASEHGQIAAAVHSGDYLEVGRIVARAVRDHANGRADDDMDRIALELAREAT